MHDMAKKTRKIRRTKVLSLVFDRLALVFFGRPSRRLVRMLELEPMLLKAGINTYPVLYVARALMYSTIILVLSLFAVFSVFLLMELPLLVKVIAVLTPFLTSTFVFVGHLMYPTSKASSRTVGVESELPFFAAYLSTMARGGLAPEKVIERITGLKIFKYIRSEAQRIMRDVRLFGRDILTAIENNAYHHPSRRYREFLLGYVTTVRTGGDVLHYLELRTQDLFREEAENLKLVAEKVGLFVEAYIALAVVATLSLYVFFVVSAILPASGAVFGGLGGMILYSLVGLPLITLMILLFIDASQPKTPITNREPYMWFVVTAPIGVLVGLTFFTAMGGTEIILGFSEIGFRHIALVATSLIFALSIASGGPTYSYFKFKSIEARLHHHVANFLRDLAEVRKTGLSPEKSIITLSDRDYGTFTPIVKRAAGALALGVNLEKAIRNAIRGYRDWLVLSALRLLVDAVEFGGGSPDIMDSIARYFRALAEFRDELKKRLRPYATMLYFGAVLLAVSSILTIVMLGGSLVGSAVAGSTVGGLKMSITQHDMAVLLLVTVTGTIVSSWLMGLVIGKIQELSTAAGFVHTIVLILITATVSVLVTTTGIGKVIPP